MPLIYYILLTALLVFPIIALILSRYVTIDECSEIGKILIVFFAVDNILYFFGYSFRGDNVDYEIFSLEYLFFCAAFFLLFRSKNILVKMFRILATVIISIGFLIGLFGILFFILILSDLKTDKIFHFVNNDKTYETRRYSLGGATLPDTRYTFETYRIFKYFPIEHKLDKTEFFDDKTDLLIEESELKISIMENGNSRKVIFKSTNGNSFAKRIN